MPDEIIKKLAIFFGKYTHLFYKKKDLILRSDDEQNSIYFINSGYVRAYRISEGGEELTLMLLKNEDFFPLTYGLNHMTKIYYLEALTDLAVSRAPQDAFLHFLKTNPDVFYELSTQIMNRFDGMLARMEYIIWSKAYTKIAATILMCVRRFGEVSNNELLIKVPLTHKDIATLVGVTRETTSIEMKKLEKKGVIKRIGKYIAICNIELLEKESTLDNQTELLTNHFL